MSARFRPARPTERAFALRSEATEAENQLWARLRRSQRAGLAFTRQVPVGPFICDRVCRSRGLIVEVDGGRHPAIRDADAADLHILRLRAFA